MSLYRRGDIWHYDFTVNAERFRGSTGLRRKEGAQKVEDRERQRATLGQAHGPVPTLEAATAQWFISRAEGLKSVKTVAQRVKIMLRLMSPSTLVSEIGPREIEAAILLRRVETTRQGNLPSNAAVNRDLIDTTLRPVLRYAKRVMEVPIKDIEWGELRLREPKGRSRSFGGDEIARWRDGLPEWHRPVFDFIGRYGVRLAEAFFPIDAFDPESGEVRLRDRKNGLPHVVSLIDDDARDMAARIGRARAARLDTAWFRDVEGELTPIHWRAFQSASRAALDAAKIADAKPVHDLRHHAATALLRDSGNLKVVQALLGHENIASTARYAHAGQDDVKRALRHAYGTPEAETPKLPAKSKGAIGT